MQLPLYQVDAFAERVFEGNPAAVVPLTSWLEDELLLAIAAENNLSETAFLVAADYGYQLRWFTPAAEVDLCGHATLAAAHVVMTHLQPELERVVFDTRSGALIVSQRETGLMMDFPASMPAEVAAPEALIAGLKMEPQQVLQAYDHIVVLASAQQVRELTPDLVPWQKLSSRGVVVTARDDQFDFVSRCFYPKLNVPEDPVTGSAHCQLAPFWGAQLQLTQVTGRQVSPRGGTLRCRVAGDRVEIAGAAVDYLVGTISLS